MADQRGESDETGGDVDRGAGGDAAGGEQAGAARIGQGVLRDDQEIGAGRDDRGDVNRGQGEQQRKSQHRRMPVCVHGMDDESIVAAAGRARLCPFQAGELWAAWIIIKMRG